MSRRSKAEWLRWRRENCPEVYALRERASEWRRAQRVIRARRMIAHVIQHATHADEPAIAQALTAHAVTLDDVDLSDPSELIVDQIQDLIAEWSSLSDDQIERTWRMFHELDARDEEDRRTRLSALIDECDRLAALIQAN